MLVLATMGLAILLASGVAQAIINGEPDRGSNAHPSVGMIYNDELLCSGTLISPKVFLTAGHCTDFLINEGLPTYVSFDPTYKPGESKVIKATPTSTQRSAPQLLRTKGSVAPHPDVLRRWALCLATSVMT